MDFFFDIIKMDCPEEIIPYFVIRKLAGLVSVPKAIMEPNAFINFDFAINRTQVIGAFILTSTLISIPTRIYFGGD